MRTSTTPLSIAHGEKRLTFHHITWPAYRQIHQALSSLTNARFTYDQGILEITMPLEDHEFANQLISRFIYILVSELGLKLKSIGSTTLIASHLNRSPEPDSAFYIKNYPLVAGKTINLSHDPPPDLVVEVDITHTDIDKLNLYAALGVPELWRYNGKELKIYELNNHQYQAKATSPTFPNVPISKLYEFLEIARTDEIAADLYLRAWIKGEFSQ